ncbi:tRNA (adenosine(37)-N6)-dimethylallyltransferase MiaA [Thermodesulfobacteriota bacterium]
MKKSKIIVIVGPTATGKSSLAVKLCKDFNGSVINADSVQVYKHLNIGSAKATKEEMDGVDHYLIDILDPNEPFSAAQFREAASHKIAELRALGKNIFVVGGTGLYVKILTGGIIDVPASDPVVRAELMGIAESDSPKALYDELSTIDNESAENISENDLFRVVRALEVYKTSGKTISQIRKEHSFKEKDFLALKIGLSMDRKRLYERIELRVDEMLSRGLLDEVKGLKEMGYDGTLKPLSSIGYKQMLMYLDGEIDYDEAVRLVKRDTKRYAKRQFTWFNGDKEISWFDSEAVKSEKEYASVKALVSEFLK